MTILYEDNHIIAVNKTCNEIVQGDKTGDTPLSDLVKAYIKEKYKKPGDVFIGVPHRIDRPTSGIVLFARTSKALTRLNEMFRKKAESVNAPATIADGEQVSSLQKIYWAIVEGKPKMPEATLVNNLMKNEKQNKSYIVPKGKGKEAIMSYRTLREGDSYTLLEIQLLTGRHHQIRCQLAAIGHPVKGDLKYGAKRSNPDGGICLHARQVRFEHPVTHEQITITAPAPTDRIWKLLKAEELDKQSH